MDFINGFDRKLLLRNREGVMVAEMNFRNSSFPRMDFIGFHWIALDLVLFCSVGFGDIWRCCKYIFEIPF